MGCCRTAALHTLAAEEAGGGGGGAGAAEPAGGKGSPQPHRVPPPWALQPWLPRAMGCQQAHPRPVMGWHLCPPPGTPAWGDALSARGSPQEFRQRMEHLEQRRQQLGQRKDQLQDVALKFDAFFKVPGLGLGPGRAWGPC